MDTRLLIEQAYSTFNRRDIDGALALMTEDVTWPKASEGGRVIGKEAVRNYWTRQWAQFDPHVEVVDMVMRDNGETAVRVHQVVKSLGGEVLSDSQVIHTYQVRQSLIARMDLGDDATGPSAAFQS